MVWRENQGPGNITMLEADDYDTQTNGKPFTFKIPFNASETIRNKFRIEGECFYDTYLVNLKELKFLIRNCVLRRQVPH